MKELRCLVFTEQEVATAVLDRRRRRHEPLPPGRVGGLTYRSDHGVKPVLRFVEDNGTGEEVVISEEDTLAAMIAFCMQRKVPLPVESDKFLLLVHNNLTMMITINFNRQPRMIHSDIGASSRRVQRPAMM